MTGAGSNPRLLGAVANNYPSPSPSMRLSTVVPCYNEADGLAELVRRLSAVSAEVAGSAYEIVLVNDGSTDGTWQEIVRLADQFPQIVGIDLARNHGHQLALTAGLSAVRGERIFIIDADLQDPPELLAEMMACLDAGADVAYGQRVEREGESWSKKASAKAFYRTLSWLADAPIPRDTGDFRLMSRRVLDILLSMPEQHRFVRGMIAWIGFAQVAVPYRRNQRYAGTTKYPFLRMVRFATDAITGFSIVPLRLSFYLGLLSVAVAFLVGIFVLWHWLAGDTVPGWASISLLVLAFGAMQMFCLAIIGEYLGRAVMQLKNRPLFVIREIHHNAQTNRGHQKSPEGQAGAADGRVPRHDSSAVARMAKRRPEPST
jgi:polyisoprenyl-phosphate glycosyltransferase